MKLEIHELSSIFPEINDADYDALVESIEQIGQREPIDVWRGQIVDGRHRYYACQQLEIEPIINTLPDNLSERDVFEIIIAKNLRRRHLTASQRAAMAATLAETYQGILEREKAAEAKPAPPADPDEEFVGGQPAEEPAKATEVSPGFIDEDKMPKPAPKPPETPVATEALERAAVEMNVSRTYTVKAKKLREEAPDLHKMLESGAMDMAEAWGIFQDRKATDSEDDVMKTIERWEEQNIIPTRLLDAIRGGVALKKPTERKKFAELDPAVAEMVSHVIEAGWQVDKAVRLLKLGVDEHMTIRDLIAKFQFDSLGKALGVRDYAVNGFTITVQPPAKKVPL